MKQFGFHWTDFRESLYRKVLLKLIDIYQFWLKLNENNRQLIREDLNAFFFAVSHCNLFHWGEHIEVCHENEAMATLFINIIEILNVNKRWRNNLKIYTYDECHMSSSSLKYLSFSVDSIICFICTTLSEMSFILKPFLCFWNVNSRENILQVMQQVVFTRSKNELCQ